MIEANGFKLPPWIFVSFTISIVILIGWFFTQLQMAAGIRVGPPFDFHVSNTSEEVCVGGNLEYDVHVYVKEVPITVNVVRTWISDKGGSNATVKRDSNVFNYIEPFDRIFHISLPVPEEMNVGPSELRVVGSVIYHEASGYAIPFTLIDCEQEE